MYITKALTNFLNLSMELSKSTIILTNLEKIIFVSPSEYNNIYINKKISHNLKNIIKLYSKDITAANYINTDMSQVIDIIDNDDVSKYQSQIILPIFNTSLEGLLIFFTEDRTYLSSNLKFAETTKHFVEIFSRKEYL